MSPMNERRTTRFALLVPFLAWSLSSGADGIASGLLIDWTLRS
jgi:hypothetical protein